MIELIKRYLKAGVMENGLLVKTEEGSPQGGPLSPLLANIYLNEYDKEMERRGVPVIRYADDIVVLSRSKRAAERLLESTQRYLEGKLKLKMNVEKSRVVSVFSARNFKFLGFALGKGRKDVYVRAHAKSLKKAKAKLKELTSRSQGQKCPSGDAESKGLHPGRLGYFGIASMKTTMQRWDEWLRRRFRCYIWKQWKRPGKRARSLIQLGIPEWQAWAVSNCRKAYWHMAKNGHVQRAISKEDSYRRDITASLTGTSLCTYAIEPPCTERYARWCERPGLFRPLLLDLYYELWRTYHENLNILCLQYG